MRIRLSGSQSVARRRWRARGVRGSSPPDRARSSGQGTHYCEDRPGACLMRIRLSGSKSAARRRRRWAWECEAAPLGLCPERRAGVPLLWGPACGLPDADRAIQQQERRSPAAEQARGVRSCSPLGCARSSGQGSLYCGGRLAACRMRIRLSGSKSAARLRRRGAWECEAAPLRAAPGAAGKGPSIVGAGPRHA
jgi:hypothetical protein